MKKGTTYLHPDESVWIYANDLTDRNHLTAKADRIEWNRDLHAWTVEYIPAHVVMAYLLRNCDPMDMTLEDQKWYDQLRQRHGES